MNLLKKKNYLFQTLKCCSGLKLLLKNVSCCCCSSKLVAEVTALGRRFPPGQFGLIVNLLHIVQTFDTNFGEKIRNFFLDKIHYDRQSFSTQKN